MKKTMLMLLMAGAALGATAQSTREVKGAVIDKNGNPLPGARVEATGGAESAVTDADGTFNIEVSRWLKSLTATYPGLAPKKLKLKDNDNEMLFRLNRKGEGNHWFVNAMMAHGFSTYRPKYIGEGGLMFGQYINKWGWFAKSMFGTMPDDEDIWASLTVGGIRHIAKPVWGYLGLGIGTGCESYYYYSPGYNYHYSDALRGIAIDWGLIFRMKKHFNLVVGFSAQGWSTYEDYYYSYSYHYRDEEKDSWRLSLQLGFGYTF